MSETDAAVHVRVLGRPELLWNGRPLRLPGRKPAALVYALAIRREGLAKDELAEIFWGPGRRSNLRSALYQLRRAAPEPDWIVEDRDADSLRLAASSDLDAFERHLANGDDRRALACLPDGAVGLGASRVLLDGFEVSRAPAFRDWLQAERERVHALVRACATRRADELADHGELDAALELATALSDEDPLDEDLHRRLMTLAWRGGDRARALRQYERCRRALAEGLGLEPIAETKELYDAIRTAGAGGDAPPGTGDRVPGSDDRSGTDELPFVGRRRELSELRHALGRHRWVTLLGPGGVGKTRLARAAASEAMRRGDGPVVFVALDAVEGVDFALAAVANTARVAFEGPERPIVQLGKGLRDRGALLVLDNAEHLQPALGVAVERLLALAPDLRVMTTSRLTSRHESEHVVRVRGLAGPRGARAEEAPFRERAGELPGDPSDGRSDDPSDDLGSDPAVDRCVDPGVDPGGDPGDDPDGDIDADLESDAVRLFVTAAHRSAPSFRLDATVAGDVVRVCRLLRGHPLGLRLAAGWLRFRSCADLADALERDLLVLDNPGVAVPARHAGLRRVMESTWALLETEEAAFLARMAVFRGDFDAAAAYEVAGAGAGVAAALTSAGWLHQAAPGRFDLHPLIREFGFERLRARPEASEVEARHARLYLSRVAAREHAILGRDPGTALDAIEADWENVRAAWTYAARSGWTGPLAAAAEALSLYADMRVRFLEAERMFAEASTALADHEGADVATRVLLASGRGSHLFRLSRFDRALEVADDAVRLTDTAPGTDAGTRHRALKLRGDVLVGAGRYAEAYDVYRATLATSQEALPDRRSRDLRALANVEAIVGRAEEAETHYRAAIAIDRENGYRVGLAIDLNNLAELLIDADRLDEAAAMIAESLEIAEGVDVHLVPYLELNLAELAEKRGDPHGVVAHARRCGELAGRFKQSALRSRAAARLASAALALGDMGEAAERLDEALAVARESGESAAALHALVVRARLSRARDDEADARACLAVVATHERSEARDVEAARRLLGTEPVSGSLPSLDALLGDKIRG